ncbi:MAG: hypothetical protein KDE09_22495, partial [Anaerolineales bacterium]|nr:hypothetical protein [Anaerolineales bacterium]
NVLKQLAIGYGRRVGASPLQNGDKQKQEETLITFTENRVTKAIDSDIDYRTPLPAETLTYQLTGFDPANGAERFSFKAWADNNFSLLTSASDIQYEETPDVSKKQKRIIERVRTLYRKEELTEFYPLGEMGPMALPGESYKLAFTPGLLINSYQRMGQPLLPDVADVLGGHGPDQGGYVDLDNNRHWWIPSGQPIFSPVPRDPPPPKRPQLLPQDETYAREHFYLPHGIRDPFNAITRSTYDSYSLIPQLSEDELGNMTTAQNDYRVLQPQLITDPNGNRTQVAFDELGMVIATAVMGKPNEELGDTLDGLDAEFTVDLYGAEDPHIYASKLLHHATTRIIYDLDHFQRTRRDNPDDAEKWLPAYAATLAREEHYYPEKLEHPRIQVSFSYSDGFGREIQKKIQAEPEEINGAKGPMRWVGSGWTIFNNKGKPVRQFEPFFSDLAPGRRHQFEFGNEVGVSPSLFYDPLERVVATLHPNDTYEKVVFDPWQQTTYDVNDTVAKNDTQTGNPRTDTDIGGYVAEYFKPQSDWQTWYEQRIKGALGAHEQTAATHAAAHANTPTTVHLDVLGRTFLTVARNRYDHDGREINEEYKTRVDLDIEGNQRAVIDAKGRIVIEYDYDMLGNRIYQLSMEAGARWILNDVTGKPIRAWDSRGHNFTTSYDALRRPMEQTVRGTTADSDPRTLDDDILVDKIEYGESISHADAFNLRTRIYRHFDSAGIAANARLDADGKPV